LYGNIPDHVSHFRYLFAGLDGKRSLTVWMWIAAILSVAAAVALLTRGIREKKYPLAAACLAITVSVWIDKGLGFIIPGFVPSPLGTVTEYHPILNEVLITCGIWSLGLLLVTVLYKVVVSVRGE
jgi:molybdopterin-containing oxidoreductase family membrane subunit